MVRPPEQLFQQGMNGPVLQMAQEGPSGLACQEVKEAGGGSQGWQRAKGISHRGAHEIGKDWGVGEKNSEKSSA